MRPLLLCVTVAAIVTKQYSQTSWRTSDIGDEGTIFKNDCRLAETHVEVSKHVARRGIGSFVGIVEVTTGSWREMNKTVPIMVWACGWR